MLTQADLTEKNLANKLLQEDYDLKKGVSFSSPFSYFNYTLPQIPYQVFAPNIVQLINYKNSASHS